MYIPLRPVAVPPTLPRTVLERHEANSLFFKYAQSREEVSTDCLDCFGVQSCLWCNFFSNIKLVFLVLHFFINTTTVQYWEEPSSIFSASYHQVSVHTSKAPHKAVSSQDEQTQLHSLCQAPCAPVPNPFGDLPGSLSSRSVSVLHVGASGWGQHAGPGQRSRILPQICWLPPCSCSPGCDLAAASWLPGGTAAWWPAWRPWGPKTFSAAPRQSSLTCSAAGFVDPRGGALHLLLLNTFINILRN